MTSEVGFFAPLHFYTFAISNQLRNPITDIASGMIYSPLCRASLMQLIFWISVKKNHNRLVKSNQHPRQVCRWMN